MSSAKALRLKLSSVPRHGREASGAGEKGQAVAAVRAWAAMPSELGRVLPQ